MPVLCEKRHHIMTLTLSRPEARNAWGDDYNSELPVYLDEATEDDDIRCVILTGDEAGSAFSAGANLKQKKRTIRNLLKLLSSVWPGFGNLQQIQFLISQNRFYAPLTAMLLVLAPL